MNTNQKSGSMEAWVYPQGKIGSRWYIYYKIVCDFHSFLAYFERGSKDDMGCTNFANFNVWRIVLTPKGGLRVSGLFAER